ncbi:hypothetical protein EVAR_100125_1 [Eumeta japonica]|uniref:Uncharacterized protein n=1 Tax=Eumeta variegata TaxID=151549 RepID=A0A4C1ZM42_EUMVA|nr:hypothetical protein EVAR_100125_1 [Eumeta japonica]
MSTNNELSDMEASTKLRMKPAVKRIFCCSVTAASGFIAAYALYDDDVMTTSDTGGLQCSSMNGANDLIRLKLKTRQSICPRTGPNPITSSARVDVRNHRATDAL